MRAKAITSYHATDSRGPVNPNPQTQSRVRDPIIADHSATDMFREKIPIRTIQLFLGHASVQTTEIYLKELIPETVRPNETTIVGSRK